MIVQAVKESRPTRDIQKGDLVLHRGDYHLMTGIMASPNTFEIANFGTGNIINALRKDLVLSGSRIVVSNNDIHVGEDLL